jgi:hypothetical protein
VQTKRRDLFATVRSEGAILPPDFLQRVADLDSKIEGLSAADYHLVSGERLNEAISRSWNRLVGAWTSFDAAREKLPESDRGTTLTRERWLLALFQELGYGRLLTATSIEIEGKPYPISHGWNKTPIHLTSFRVDLDTRTPGAAGASRISPHGMVQELLNRSEENLWAFLSNGLRLRILRDNASLTRLAYVEFDLEAMMEGEFYSDFVLLWLLCHQSRVEAERPELCLLEKWTQAAQEQGTRALEGLRQGVEEAISTLGQGFISHAANSALKDKLRSGELSTQDYYRQLLRTVYRLLFLFVAEDRDLLLLPDASDETKGMYRDYYSTTRLRRMAENFRGTRHGDLWRSLHLVFEKLGQEEGCPELGLPALGSFLWSDETTSSLEGCELSNQDLLVALRALTTTQEGRYLRGVDYKNLGSEELGSVYESLLELHPELNIDAGTFALKTASGHERKTTGSYYTPSSLITCLLDSALDPVLDEAAKKDDPEAAILDLKVCDPACGSGHFLIAAAHRIAKRLAAVWTGDEEPSPEATRRALRDVVGRCIYGVDINPMAVELCKVSLWMEALEPGKPLSFLDHRIQCGNSLLGTTPALMKNGIPDEAFKPIEGDDKEACKEFRKRNRDERKGQGSLFTPGGEPWERLGDLAASLTGIEDVSDDTLEGVQEKQKRYEELVRSSGYLFGHLLADTWCAAFIWKKTDEFDYSITENIFRQIEQNPHTVAPWMREEIQRLAEQYQFFHWHLAFPDVFRVSGETEVENEQAGWGGGFDVVLGNPPWDRIKIHEKEWFAGRNSEIEQAPNAAARSRFIANLINTDPTLHRDFSEAKRVVENQSHFLRNSTRYPLTGHGELNTYPAFAETYLSIVNRFGYIGIILPTGIATDDGNKEFFSFLVSKSCLKSLYDFKNHRGLFSSVAPDTKFSLITINLEGDQEKDKATLAFFLTSTDQTNDEKLIFQLSLKEFSLINPNTNTCPIFRNSRDAEITSRIYQKVPVFLNEMTGEDPWGISFLRMFDMSLDSSLFRTREQLENSGHKNSGYYMELSSERWEPLYEAKMVIHFDHRFGTHFDLSKRKKTLPTPSSADHFDPEFCVLPWYWVPQKEVIERTNKWRRGYFIGFRDVTDAMNERTAIFSALPLVGVSNKFPLLLPSKSKSSEVGVLLGNLNSYIFDFVVRQKLGGTSMNYFYVKQFPVLPPKTYKGNAPWAKKSKLLEWISNYVLELSYTSWDLKAFAEDCGYNGTPFYWEEDRRFLLLCELDASFFHLYEVDRDNVDYIMKTFSIVKRKDEKAHGEYRTKRVILEIYDEMAEAIRTGKPYQTRLDPPPADPRVAHPPREEVTTE